jgi:hypothetical protein
MQLHLDLFGIEPLDHFVIHDNDNKKEKQTKLVDDKEECYRVLERVKYESSNTE